MSEYDSKTLDYFGLDRQDIGQCLPHTADRICEIGCGAGSTLVSLRRRYNASFVAGFDIHGPSIEAARTRLDHAEVLNVEAAPLPDYVSDIDLFLCLDVLEHLRDPWSLIGELHKRLKPGGAIVASIPNIRYHSASFGLLFGGKWNLADSGLLDRTHLRFFVRDTAVELMASSGLHVDMVVPNIVRRLDRIAVTLSGGGLEGLCSLQYIVRAIKST